MTAKTDYELSFIHIVHVAKNVKKTIDSQIEKTNVRYSVRSSVTKRQNYSADIIVINSQMTRNYLVNDATYIFALS